MNLIVVIYPITIIITIIIITIIITITIITIINATSLDIMHMVASLFEPSKGLIREREREREKERLCFVAKRKNTTLLSQKYGFRAVSCKNGTFAL